jgi:hypothetical protein
VPREVQHVAVVNRSGLPDGEVALYVEGYRPELGRLCDAWSLPTPGLAMYGRQHDQAVAEEAAILLVDSGGDPDAFGAHTALGLAAWGYVDVGLCRADGEHVSTVFGHELFELVVDPFVDRWAGPYEDGSHIAVEVCDPVQRQARGKLVADQILGQLDLWVADWVPPRWFDGSAGDVTSYQGQQLTPQEDAPGGYHVTERDGAVLTGAARVKSFGRTFRRLARGRR